MALLNGGRGSTSGALKSVDRTNFVATAGQTVFTLTQGYAVGDTDVYLNGVKLVDSDDYYAINGSTVVLTSGTIAGDYLQVVSYNQFNAANTYTKTESDSRYMVATGTTPMSSYLRTPNYGVSSYSDTASASLEANVGLGESGVGIKAFGRSMATNGGDILYTSDSRGAGGRHRFGNWNGTVFTQTMGIDSSGRMTLPYQPAFHAYGNSTWTSPNYLIYPSTNFNVGGHYNTSNGRFTAPVTGTYMFGWTHIGSTNNTVYRYYARVNGSNISGSEYGTNGMYTIPWKMNAGDYFQVYFQSDDNSSMHGGSASTTNDYPRFWGYLLG
jgi:hypothetical protein